MGSHWLVTFNFYKNHSVIILGTKVMVPGNTSRVHISNGTLQESDAITSLRLAVNNELYERIERHGSRMSVRKQRSLIKFALQHCRPLFLECLIQLLSSLSRSVVVVLVVLFMPKTLKCLEIQRRMTILLPFKESLESFRLTIF